MPTVVELRKDATKFKIKGRSKLNKDSLEKELLKIPGSIMNRSNKNSRKRRSGRKLSSSSASRRKPSRKRRSGRKPSSPGASRRKPSRKRTRRKPSRKRVSRKRRISENSLSNLDKDKIESKQISKIISNKKKILKCTQNMEMISQIQSIEDIPDELRVILVLQENPAIIHCYNISDLRGWVAAGFKHDPMTKIPFTEKQMNSIILQWNKLNKIKIKKNFIDTLVEDEHIKTKSSPIPSWNGKDDKPKYDIVISISTPYPYMVAIHVMSIEDKKIIPQNLLNSGLHHSMNDWNSVRSKSKWVIMLPAPGDSAVTTGTSYRSVTGDTKEIDSGSDSAAILGDIIKAFENNKLFTKSNFVKGMRRGIDDEWKLNLPMLVERMITNFGYLPQIKWLRDKKLKNDILKKGGVILSVELWEFLRGGKSDIIRYPDPYFYKLWSLVVEQINYLIYNETPQY